ncbi:MAG TPA: ABC transporter permease [Pirellulales bacterium]|jgi:lipopolysaccharide transport system permease protein|nr:ABC transporter permease [Pirellulales bacterium]
MIDYCAAVWRTRYFWWSLVTMDLRSRYHGSVLGLGWSLLNPILMTAVISTVFCQLFNQDFRSFAPFLLLGLAFWNYLTACVMEGCQSFQRGEAYIRQHPAPLAIYPLRIALGAMIHLLMTLAVVLVLVWIVKGFGNLPALVSLVPTLLTLLVLGWATAVCMGLINVLVNDTQYLIPVLMQVLFYLTPVMYPPELLRQKGLTLLQFNPLAAYLDMFRLPVLEGRLPGWEVLAVGMLTALAVASLAAAGLAVMQRRLVFYL